MQVISNCTLDILFPRLCLYGSSPPGFNAVWVQREEIMLYGKKKRKRKMWFKKWYLERNISCDTHLLNELLETDVP